MTRGAHTWPEVLSALLSGDDLSYEQAAWAMGQTMDGLASPAQVAGLLVALRAKGESVDEVRALAEIMVERAHPLPVTGPTLDIVGTGGDRFGTVNISTMSSIVIAATGVTVVKHGNRAASSRSGSADVLESLGVNLRLSPAQVREVAERAGITFAFAQTFHPSMRHSAEARAALGVPTAFNLLGPLTNPARPTWSAIGVADAARLSLLAEVFAARGQEAVTFRGDEGLDEMSVCGPSRMLWVGQGRVDEYVLAPEDVGLERRAMADLLGEDAAYNAGVARRVLDGEHGAPRDAVLLNAGVALALASGAHELAAGPHESLVAAVAAGVEAAAESIDSGRAAEQLARWAAVSREVADR